MLFVVLFSCESFAVSDHADRYHDNYVIKTVPNIMPTARTPQIHGLFAKNSSAVFAASHDNLDWLNILSPLHSHVL